MSIFQAWLTTESIRFRTRALKALLRDQRAEFLVIWRHLRPGDIACDIGANKGSFISGYRGGLGTGGWSHSSRSRYLQRASPRSVGR